MRNLFSIVMCIFGNFYKIGNCSSLGIFVIFFLISIEGVGATYYVSPQGSDKNSGTSRTNPFKSLQAAADIVFPGDTVVALAGVYSSSPSSSIAILAVQRGGQPGAYVTFKSEVQWKAKIDGKNVYERAISVSASYVRIEGFEITNTNRFKTVLNKNK